VSAGRAPAEGASIGDKMLDITAAEYQRLLDIAAQAEVREGIRQGLEDARAGRLRPAEEFFEEFEALHGLSL